MSTMTNFLGSFLQLQDRVMLTQYLGRWEDRGNHKMFRAENGAVMHWWLPKGTIHFNGKADAALDFEKAMVTAGKLILKAQAEALNKDDTKKPRPLRTLPDWLDEKAEK